MPELDCHILRRGYYIKHGENIVIIMIYKLLYKYVLEILGKFLLLCHWFSCYWYFILIFILERIIALRGLDVSSDLLCTYCILSTGLNTLNRLCINSVK